MHDGISIGQLVLKELLIRLEINFHIFWEVHFLLYVVLKY